MLPCATYPRTGALALTLFVHHQKDSARGSYRIIRSHRADQPFVVGTVPEPFDAMPNCSTNGLYDLRISPLFFVGNKEHHVGGEHKQVEGEGKDVLPYLRLSLAVRSKWSGGRTECAAKVIKDDPRTRVSGMVDRHGNFRR